MIYTSNVIQHLIGDSWLFSLDNNDDEMMIIFEILDDELFEDDLFCTKKRNYRWNHIRNNWMLHVSQLVHETHFKREYRMTFQTWNKLRTILTPKLQRKHSKSRCDYPIEVDIIMAIGMRWFTGTPVSSARHIVNMSRAEAY